MSVELQPIFPKTIEIRFSHYMLGTLPKISRLFNANFCMLSATYRHLRFYFIIMLFRIFICIKF